MEGSVGDLTFRQANGQTVVSQKITAIANPRSESQMRTRTKFTNIIAMYKGIRPLLNHGFESKQAGLSDYNMFVRVNMQKTPVYLTKQAVAGGACVACGYQITQGSLPSIVVTGSGNSSSTDIYLGSLTLGASTTIGEFSLAVVSNNADYKYGDQISYFEVSQKTNAETGIPYCQFSAKKVILDASDTSILWDAVGRNGFYSQDSMLGHYGANFVGAFGWVHSRKSNGKTLVSSQSLVAVNDTLLNQYQGDMAFNLASASYGQSQEVFLSPDSESTGTGGDTTPSGGGGGNDSL
jgi:hypothetical protein